MANVWTRTGYGWVMVGPIKKKDSKNIWVDTTQGQQYFRKGVVRFILRSNGQYASDLDGERFWLYFHPNPLVKFISNGL